MEAVYRGILERMYGPNTFINENNSPEWKNSSSKYSTLSQWTRVSKRWFDFDKNNVRLSFMFDGASEIADDWGGAVVEDFTTSTRWENYRSELRRIIRESIAQCRPITLFFNSGLHDIYSGRNLTGDGGGGITYIQPGEEVRCALDGRGKERGGEGSEIWEPFYYYYY